MPNPVLNAIQMRGKLSAELTEGVRGEAVESDHRPLFIIQPKTQNRPLSSCGRGTAVTIIFLWITRRYWEVKGFWSYKKTALMDS